LFSGEDDMSVKSCDTNALKFVFFASNASAFVSPGDSVALVTARHLWLRPCRVVTLVFALTVLSASTAFAQGWHDYISRDEFFLVSMPSEPQITSTSYRAASGAMLPAKQFVATEGQRRYTVTVVHYMNASAADEAAALEHAVRSFRSRPAQVTYDRAQVIEGVPGHMIYLLNPDRSRVAAGVILHPRDTGHGGPGRLYILEGQVDASFFPDIDTRQPVYPIRGSLLRFNCEREGRNVAWGRADPGANCLSFLEANAAGHCYKTTAGVWSCSMSDLVTKKTERVAPPK
jgi:hypothetical protein